jgi:NAD(P)-dependent dehydrogenase (short-subunit alcohol dehydrogenase family)
MSTASETEFTGKRALVTGGTRGIGAAIVRRLSGAGATVVTTARSTPQDLLQPDLFVAADLCTAAGAETVIRFVRDRFGGVDILVHNVGGSSAPGGGFAALTDDDWQHALNGNLLAAVRLDRGLLPLMLAQGAGVIIHISSIQTSCSEPIAQPCLRARQGRSAVCWLWPNRRSPTRGGPVSHNRRS